MRALQRRGGLSTRPPSHERSNIAPPKAILQALREADSLLRGPYHGATMHTQTYLMMGRLQPRRPSAGGAPYRQD